MLITLTDFCPLPCHLPWSYVPIPSPLMLISPQWGLACKAGSYPLILPRSSTISALAERSGVGCGDSPRDKLHNSPQGHWLTQAFLCPLFATGSPDKYWRPHPEEGCVLSVCPRMAPSDCHLTGPADAPRRPEELGQRDASGSDRGSALGPAGRPRPLTLHEASNTFSR